MGETLSGILQQTYSNWECLMVDDGSTDNTKEVAEKYVKKDKRFLYFARQNGGPSAARNYGIEQAKGEYIQFLDADDMLEKEKLRRQVEIMENNRDCGLVYGDSVFFHAEVHTHKIIVDNILPAWQQKVSGQGENILGTLLNGNIMSVQSPLIRKSVFTKAGLFDEDIWFNEDWDLWLRCAINNLVFIYDGAAGTKALIRIHENNRSKDGFLMNLNGLKIRNKTIKLLVNIPYLSLRMFRRSIVLHYNFLEKNIIESKRISNEEARLKAEGLYLVTNLRRHKTYLWVLNKLPFIFALLFQKMLEMINFLKKTHLYATESFHLHTGI